MKILSSLFKTGTKELIDSVGGVLDNLITNKEELAKAKLEAEKEINRHTEALEDKILRQQELDIQDRQTARSREAEVVKATGKYDYMMWSLAFCGVAILFYCLYYLVNYHIENKELFIHFLGIIEGVVVSIYGYYFGSSLGSRIKDSK